MKEIKRHLYLNEEITDNSVIELVETINEINDDDDAREEDIINMAQSLISQGVISNNEIKIPEREPIMLEINCAGGSLSAGFMLITAIENSVTPIIGYVTGHCMSMTVAILASCDFKISSRFASFMIHEVSSGFFGKFGEMMPYLGYIDNGRANYKNVITDNTGIDDERLEEMMKRNHDYFFFPEEALEIGLIDCIDIDGIDVNLFNKKVYGISMTDEIDNDIDESINIDNEKTEEHPDTTTDFSNLSDLDVKELFPLNVE